MLSDTEERAFVPESADTEEEVPLYPSGQQNTASVTEKRFEAEEKDKVRKEKRYFSGIGLIIGCLGLLFLVYIIEVDMRIRLGIETADVTDNVIEIIKTLLFTLSGYLFGKRERED